MSQSGHLKYDNIEVQPADLSCKYSVSSRGGKMWWSVVQVCSSRAPPVVCSPEVLRPLVKLNMVETSQMLLAVETF